MNLVPSLRDWIICRNSKSLTGRSAAQPHFHAEQTCDSVRAWLRVHARTISKNKSIQGKQASHRTMPYSGFHDLGMRQRVAGEHEWMYTTTIVRAGVYGKLCEDTHS